nr:Histone deacetylase superfamily domain containing protein [Haemonchus contortus]
MSFNRSSTKSSSSRSNVTGERRQTTGSDKAIVTDLLVDITDDQCPLVFHEIYDVKMFGVEKCHPFDAGKWGRVYAKLKKWKLVSDETIVKPNEATRNDLLIAHSKFYLGSLYSPCILAKVVEVPVACLLPHCITDKYFLKRMRYQVGGTVAACRIALDRNWAIHLGGGFHHAYRTNGGGFCVYADISLALKILFALQLIEKAMIVDVDAHQICLGVFKPRLLKKNLAASLAEFKCDLVLYNAGTDSLEDDPLGCLNLSEECIVRRDELVFRLCKENTTPIAMVTSGGYLMSSAKVIAKSIRNLHQKELIHLKA